eukprot:GFUD01030106.1.p1 GENE.GFUD01030106.1~~GFUD01030106.1.p1  ORF type:complete len:428 (-),score=81.22 GFUD01030106.1:8-1291(-)
MNMNKLIWPLIIFTLYTQMMNVSADDLLPDYYRVDYTNSNPGFYKKENYEHNGKPVYKKPKLEEYLYFNKVDKWAVGVKWTSNDVNAERLTMKEDGHEKPTSGAWQVQKTGFDFEKIDVTITEYSPKYPAYYEVKNTGSDRLEGFYEKLPESKNYENFPLFRKHPSFRADYVLNLYLDINGNWRISLGLSTTYAKSSPKGLPTPEFSKAWKVWITGTWNWKTSDNFTIVPTNPLYPLSYTVTYVGQDQLIRNKLEGLLGKYTKQYFKYDNVPVYKKEGNEMNIFRVSKGNWVISYDLMETEGKLYQESNGSPTLLQDMHWKLNGTKEIISGFAVNQPRTARKLDGVDVDGQGNSQTGNTGPILIVAIIVGVLTTVIVISISAFCFKKRFCKKVEEPKIDENWYYGDDYDDNDNDNAIVDDNDYYGQI